MFRSRRLLMLILFTLSAATWTTIVSAQTDAQNGPSEAEKTEGLRILSSGHSWVAPAMKSLPIIASRAGLERHEQRYHLRGGAGGSARAIWAVESGLLGKKKQILFPLIDTGNWDVMTLGAYYDDKPEYYIPWIKRCLRYNPDMVFYIQDGWPTVPGDRKAGELKLAMFLRGRREIGRTMKSLIEPLEEKYPGKVRAIPAGAAMCEMLRLYFAGELPGIDGVSQHLGSRHALYRDGRHLCESAGMGWFEGYIYYASLYKKSPELLDIKSPVFNEELDKIMRQVAWKAVVDHPYAHVDDKNKNGIADEIEEATGR